MKNFYFKVLPMSKFPTNAFIQYPDSFKNIAKNCPSLAYFAWNMYMQTAKIISDQCFITKHFI
tara:strand:+ start:1326 stop:1514 length:189 start_codon:yes stop_codon:yes gene_type:complete